MKRTPLIRKTPIAPRKGFAAMSTVRRKAEAAEAQAKAVAIRPALRRGRSTGKPTKAQMARWDDLRARGCVACHLNMVDHGLARASYGCGLEIHHLLSGGRRRGHDVTVCLCHYHHQAKRLVFADKGYMEHARIYGPSLERESRRFHEVYGTDDQLLEYQNRMVEQLPPQFGPEAA